MASEVTVTILRFAFLALIWLFVFMILAASRRDLGVGRNFRTTRVASSGSGVQVESRPMPAQQPATPPPPARPSQLVLTDGEQAGLVIRLGDEPITMGRAHDIELPLKDDYASGRHARLFPQGSRWFLEDLNSTNGTFVGGQRLTRATPIEPGVDFRIGRTSMQLRA